MRRPETRRSILCQTPSLETADALQRAVGDQGVVIGLDAERCGPATIRRMIDNHCPWALVVHAADAAGGRAALALCEEVAGASAALPCFIASHAEDAGLLGPLAAALNSPAVQGHLLLPFEQDAVAAVLESNAARRVRGMGLLRQSWSDAPARAAAAAYRNVLHLVASPVGALEMNSIIQRDQLQSMVTTSAPLPEVQAISLQACMEVQDDTIASVGRMGKLVQQLKSRVDGAADDRGPCDGAAVANTLLSAFGRDDVRVQLDVPDGLSISIGPTALAIILGAMLDNALSASPPPPVGRVRLSARPVSSGLVEFELADNGPGVRAEHATRIFEPFFTTHNDHVGLGLSVAEELARGAGGKVRLSTESGPGARFLLQLPSDGPFP